MNITKRPMYTYKLPKGDTTTFDGTEINTISIVELTAAEEDNAARAAPKGKELEHRIFASLRKVNGSPITDADGSADKLFASLRPRQRNFFSVAYMKLHGTTKEEDNGFLDTVQATIE